MTSNIKTKSDRPDKEISEFHNQFRPFVDRIYRGAIILTRSPKAAEKLQVKIYLSAFMAYLQAGDTSNFKEWIIEIVRENFSTHKSRSAEELSNKSSMYEKAIELVRENN